MVETRRKSVSSDPLEERIEVIDRWALTLTDELATVERVEWCGCTVERRSNDGTILGSIQLGALATVRLRALLDETASDVERLEVDNRPEVVVPIDDETIGQTFTVAGDPTRS